jgi:RNA recognition motif-containing protein
MRLYVGGLPPEAGAGDVAEAFSRGGNAPPSSVTIVADRETGASRGFAFVDYDDREEGMLAMAEADGAEVLGGRITVCKAKRKKAEAA